MNSAPDDAGRGPTATTESEDSAPQGRGARELLAVRTTATRAIVDQALDSTPPRRPDPRRAVLPIPCVPPASPDAACRRGQAPPENGATHDDDGCTQDEHPNDAHAPSTADPTPLDGVPLLWRAREVAAALRVSLRTLWRLDAIGKLPSAVHIGTAKRWRRDEVVEWIAEGCPDRAAWDVRRAASR